MAEIYKARMEGIGGFNRLFAIKRILPTLSENREYIDLLVDEAKIAGLLSHANIVQILDLGQVNGQYYVAMEYVHGRDLGNVLSRCRERGITLPVPHSVFTLIEVLKGLEYAHNRQITRNGKQLALDIIHRDVTPSNVLVSFQGEIKLTDFGIAKAKVKAMETVSGVIKGKFDYMAPEQAAGEDIDQRTDIFAAGVLLYEMLCGVHPFRKGGDLQTIEAIREGNYPPPTEVNPDVPYSLEVILDEALARDPDQRFASATTFKDALTRFFHDAGFIFSHSTLAAFLKGLFPKEQKGRRRDNNVVALKDQETRPIPLKKRDDSSSTDLVDMPSVAFGPVDTIEQPTLDTSGVTAKLTPDITSLADQETAKLPQLDLEDVDDGPTSVSDALPSEPSNPEPESEPSKQEAQDDPLPDSTSGLLQYGLAIVSPEDVDDVPTEFVDESAAETQEIRTPEPDDLDALDEETLLRNVPLEPMSDQWADDVATVIRDPMTQPLPRGLNSDPLEEISLDDETRPGLEKLIKEEPRAYRTNKAYAKAPPPRPRPPIQQVPHPRRRPEARPSRRTRQFVLLVGTLCLAVGFAFGAILGSLAQELKSPDKPAKALVQKSQPKLLVTLPAGARLEVDGRTVPLERAGPTPVRVEPGRTVRLKVLLDGHKPFETEATLNHNEQLWMRVDVETLEPQ